MFVFFEKKEEEMEWTLPEIELLNARVISGAWPAGWSRALELDRTAQEFADLYRSTPACRWWLRGEVDRMEAMEHGAWQGLRALIRVKLGE